MASKRNHNSLEPVSAEPAKKRQKLTNDESLETKDESQVLVCMHTKLGDSQRSFDTNDVQKIAYFKNQLSSRWNNNNNDNTCTITCNDLRCSVDEVEALIYLKNNNKIYEKYPYDRLIYFCNACGYLAEKIDLKTFKKYFNDCIPAITYSRLIALKKLCNSNECKEECENVMKAIDAIISQMNIDQEKRNNLVVNNWENSTIQLLTSNLYIAATVFVTTFKFSGISFLLSKRKASDIKQLWKYILDKHAYRLFPGIIDTVYAVQARTQMKVLSKGIPVTIANIMMDVMDICVKNNLKFRQNENLTMIRNIFAIMSTVNNEFTTRWSGHYSGIYGEYMSKRLDDAKAQYFNYDYFFDVLRKLLVLRNKNADKFRFHFGEHIIVKLLSEKFSEVTGIIEWRPFINDIKSLKVHEQFTKIEKHQLLATLLSNYNFILRWPLLGTSKKKKKELQNMIKELIETDYDQSFKLTKSWFPIFMVDHKNWIINEIPNKTSLKTLKVLIHQIYEYAVAGNKIEQEYFELIRKYSNN